MSNLQGKKLLILGGPALACEIVKKAQELGIYVIVTDWYSEDRSPAKKLADKSLMVSTADVTTLTALVRDEEIDGILTGFTDSTLPYYQQLCERVDLPCYATAEQINITTNKRRFKQTCHEHGIPVVPEYEIKRANGELILNDITYPVLVKPADNSGARGITVCYDEKQLKDAYATALSFSESKTVLVERYMFGKEATIFYVFENGEIHLTAMADRHMGAHQDGVIPLPVAYTFPSVYLERYQSALDEKVRSMFRAMGLKNGMAFIQTFIEGKDCVFYEIGFRLTGSLEYKVLDKTSGINPMEMMIRFALTGRMTEVGIAREQIKPNFATPAFNITFLIKPGRVGEILGVEEVLEIPGVIDAFSSYGKGDLIPSTAKGTLQQIALRVFGVADNMTRMIEMMDEVHSKVRIVSSSKQNMLLQHFDTKGLLAYCEKS